VIRIREDTNVPLLDWKFSNTFWVDTVSGIAWRSEQHFAPGLPPLEIEVLKPAA
jgi:hypothetical protein